MKLAIFRCSRGGLVVSFALWAFVLPISAGSLTGSTRSLQGGSINLTSNGTLDWVHWGLYSENSVNRKAAVVPQISDFSLLDNTNGFAFAYQYSDNHNGYTWTDGEPIAGVTNTTTGIWAYGIPSMGTGFQITAPAGTAPRELKVYCGVFAGTGHFEASLSDGSAPDYTTSFSNIPGGGPSHEVTLQYTADDPDQVITVRWRLQVGAGMSPNVTLQAATLSADGGNIPPIVRLTSPVADENLVAPGDFTLSATATDPDGTIAKVEFFANSEKIGEAVDVPYQLIWTNPPLGKYVLKVVATDSSGEKANSLPVDVTVHSAGGSLAALAAFPPTSVNLTAEGLVDWQHWGASSSNLFNRKEGTSPQIGQLTPIGSTDLRVYADNFTGFSWSNGIPLENATNLKRGVFLYGLGNGFQLTAPADLVSRRLKIYAGVYGAQGHFEAWLTDFSSPTYHDHSLSNLLGSDYRVFTLDYAAASSGQTLNVRYTSEKLFDGTFGNVTFQAATLVGGPTLLPVQIINPIYAEGQFRFSLQTQPGPNYLAQWRDALGTGDWQTFATVAGTGQIVTVTNLGPIGVQRFYRVETQ